MNKSVSMSSFLVEAIFVYLLSEYCFSAPIDTPYSSFVADMTRNNCTLPSQIPLSFGAKETTVETSLQICNSPEFFKFNKEVPVLCNEIFGFLKNISCSPQSAVLSKIQISISSEVCKDFASQKSVLPAGLLGHLSDSFNCELMCSEEFEAPCKVLLWSFLVQNQMKSAETPEIRTTKSSSVSETKLPPKKQIPQIKTSNDKESQVVHVNLDAENKGKSQGLGNIDTSANSKEIETVVTVPEMHTTPGGFKILGSNSSLDHLNSKEPKAAINTAQDKLPTKSNAVVSKDVQPPSMKNPVEETGEGKIIVNSTKIKNFIPISNSLQPIKQNEIDETDHNGNVENDHLVSEIPQEKASTIHDEIMSQPEPPLESKEHNSDGLNNAVEESVKETENHEPENSAVENQKGSVYSVSDSSTSNGATSKSDQKPNASEKNADDSAAQIAENLPTLSPYSDVQPPSVDSVSAAVSVTKHISSPAHKALEMVTPALEKMDDEIPLSNDKESDQYNDLDNADGDLDGEYSKQEYGDGGMYEPTKNKESISESPKSVDFPKEPVIPLGDVKVFSGLPSREEIQGLSFPDQEDSHFFFYFLSVVLILMAGYLIFHNKQKIIALIVEGRHERRRRSHGLGYKKLETK